MCFRGCGSSGATAHSQENVYLALVHLGGGWLTGVNGGGHCTHLSIGEVRYLTNSLLPAVPQDNSTVRSMGYIHANSLLQQC